jgi:hypothetical protein
MRFHNIDLHVAVIEDVRFFLERLGHCVDVNNLSGHTWALGRPRRRTFANIRAGHWEKDILRPWTAASVWLATRGFAGYDGAITTHLPALGLAYEWMRRPLVTVLSARYQLPFSAAPERWQALTDFFVERRRRGLSTCVANNQYDAAYFEYFTGIRPRVIPSVCAYIDFQVKSPWTPNDGPVLVFGEPKAARVLSSHVPGAGFVRDLYPQYEYDQVIRARAHVIVPYNASTMSFFEHYRLGIPQFAPTPRFLSALRHEGLALNQLTDAGFGQSPVPRRGGTLPDPNDARHIDAWFSLHDIYTFPFVTLFDSFEELSAKIAACDGAAISARMRAFNERREIEAQTGWSEVFEDVQNHGRRSARS